MTLNSSMIFFVDVEIRISKAPRKMYYEKIAVLQISDILEIWNRFFFFFFFFHSLIPRLYILGVNLPYKTQNLKLDKDFIVLVSPISQRKTATNINKKAKQM